MSASPQNPGASAGSELRLEPRARKESLAPTDHVRRSDALPSLLMFAQLRRQESAVGTWRKSALGGSVLDEVLQQVAERAQMTIGADGVAIALRNKDEIVCRASAGAVAPDAGARVNPKAGFSGECLISGSVVLCDDAENDARVDASACRALGAQSMLAVPLSAKQKVIGLIAAFSSEKFGFNDADVRSLSLLAELILAAIRPEEDDRLAQKARAGAEVDTETPGGVELPIEKPTEKAVWPGTAAEAVEPVAHDIREEIEPQQAEPRPLPTAASATNTVMEDTALQVPVIQTAMAEAAVAKSPVIRPLPPVELAPSADSPAKWTGVALVAASVVIVLCLGGTAWLVHSRPRGNAKASSGQAANQVAQTQLTVSTPEAETQELKTNEEVEAPVKPGEMVSVTGVRHWAAGEASTVVIDLGNHVQYEAHRLSGPERIYFDLHDTKLAATFVGKSIDVGDAMLQKIRVGQSSPGITRVVLETKGTPDFAVSLEQNPYRLAVEIRKAGAKPLERSTLALFTPMAPVTTTAVVSGAGSAKPTVPTLPNVLPKAIPAEPMTAAATPALHIALDAGHGGWDLGTVGKTGLLEKDLVLDIVARLGKLVESRMGATVIYTRQNDDYVPLEKRAEVANLAHADLFLSVHANYSDSVSARGVETYYSNSFSSVKAHDPRDSDATLKDVNWTNVDIREKVHDSHRFAADVQHALFGALVARNPGLPNRGVKEAEYVVLTGTSMPAVLAEVSFVSSPTDEGNLKNPEYRQQIAEALYQGIAGYEKDAGRVSVASAKPTVK
jgi:N-acetylmuramoyl-L-alanine amidase/putative methionine-R-sulfoxide reductase with GAF domain